MDNILLILFFSFLAISVVLIIITLVSLPQLGDERKNLIKMRAQSYTFAVVIGYTLIKWEEIYIELFGAMVLMKG